MSQKPWTKSAGFMVGGLTDLGFVPGTSLLLVASHQGRGLFDCVAQQRVARDDDASGAWYDAKLSTVLGIGAAQGRWISVTGLGGGRGIESTRSGWHARRDSDVSVTLTGPGGPQAITDSVMGVRAFSFSDDGHFFALGTPADVTVYLSPERRWSRVALVRFLTPEEGGRRSLPQSRVRSQLEIGDSMTSCDLHWGEGVQLQAGIETQMHVRLLVPGESAKGFHSLGEARFFEGSRLVGEGRFLEDD